MQLSSNNFKKANGCTPSRFGGLFSACPNSEYCGATTRVFTHCIHLKNSIERMNSLL
jgi:hypothetical protein